MRPNSSDRDVADWIAGPYDEPNASCSRCGRAFYKGPDDIGPLCDRCCAKRDARADQLRLDAAAHAIIAACSDFEHAIAAAQSAREALALRRRLRELYTVLDHAEGSALRRADMLCAQEK